MSHKFVLKSTPEYPIIGSYVTVLEPRPTPDGNQEKYSISLVIPKKHPQLDALRKAIQEAASDKFGAKAPAALEAGKLKSPLRDGDVERDDDPVYKGCYFLNASSLRKPQVVDRKIEPVYDSEEVYSGCHVNCSFNLFPYDKSGNKGVGAGLNNLQVVHKGERIDGSTSAEDDFEEVKDAGEDEDLLD